MSEQGMLLPGQRLRAEREARGISQEEAAGRLNLTVTFLQALETDDYERLPEATFVRGYIRNYARELDLPADELVSVFSEILQEQEKEEVPETVEVMPSRRRRWLPAVSVVVVLAAVIAALLWPQEDAANQGDAAPAAATEETAPGSAEQDPGSEQTESAGEAAGPDESGDSEAESAPELEPVRLAEGQNEQQPDAGASADRLEMTFSGDCWLEVRDATGEVVFEGRRSAGVALNVSGEAPFDLRIGNASAVESLTINDEQQTMPSRAAGQVVRLSVP